MDPFSMVVAIVFIGVFGSLGKQALQAWNGRASGPSASEASLRQDVAALKQRVAALEVIVTEPGYDLKRKISELDSGPRHAA